MNFYKKITYSFLVLVIGCTTQLNCWGASVLNQALRTIIPSAVNILPVGGTNIIGSIDPETGNNSGVQGRFSLVTNGSDSVYDFILQSSLLVKEGGTVNAYAVTGGSTPVILLGSNATTLYPTTAAVNNIKTSPVAASNPNVIAYPITTTVTAPSSVSFVNDTNYGGYCFKVLLGATTSTALTQTVGVPAVSNTYLYSVDRPGTYQAVLTFSAFRKP